MRTLLVTGATGFVGRATLTSARARGFDVHAVARRAPPPDLAPEARWHRADLLATDDRARLLVDVRPTHLLHLAWIAEHGRYWEAPENDAWVDASVDLAARFAAMGGKRFVGAGSCAEYDWSDGSLAAGTCKEGITPCRPSTLYGRSKLRFCEHLAAHPSLSQSWGRLFFLYGPWEDPRRLVPTIIQSLLEGRPARLGPGSAVRDFLDVREAAAALVALVDCTAQGPVNIASGTSASIGEVGATIAKIMGQPERIEPGALPPRAGDPPRLVASTSRLVREVGFTPAADLTQGLTKTVDWWSLHRAQTLSSREDQDALRHHRVARPARDGTPR